MSDSTLGKLERLETLIEIYRRRSVVGATTATQMVGCRSGGNGSFAGFSSTNFNSVSQTRHILPYGADAIQLVYAGFAITTASSFKESAVIASVWSLGRDTLTINAGGTGYAVNDTVTGPTGNAVTAWIGRVLSVSAGAILKLQIIRPGFYWGTSPPADGMVPSATSGSGSAATFNGQWDGWAAGAHLSLAPSFEGITSPITMIGSGASELASIGGPYSDMTESWDLLIPSGDVLVTEPIPIDVAPGGDIGLRGNIVSFNAQTGRSVLSNEFCAIGTTYFERANAGSLTTSQANNLYQPAGIIGVPKVLGPTLLIVGDSRAFGFVGASVDPGDSDGNVGWLERATVSKIPFSNHARGSMQLAALINATPPAFSRWGLKRVIQMLRPSSVYLNLSINDFIANATSAATVQSWETQLVSWLRGLRVKLVFTDTCDPNTTSSDGWATVANQTITGGGALAVQRNAALRSQGASGYAGYDFFIDQAGITEAIANGVPSGLWVASGTTDGVHATQAVTILKANNAKPIFTSRLI